MKVVKLNKKMLNMHPADLLIKLDAVNLEKQRAYPNYVYFSKEDYKSLKDNLKRFAKKQAPSTPERLLNYSVGMDLLNYGPNQLLENVIKPGFALLDEEAINREKVISKLQGEG